MGRLLDPTHTISNIVWFWTKLWIYKLQCCDQLRMIREVSQGASHSNRAWQRDKSGHAHAFFKLTITFLMFFVCSLYPQELDHLLLIERGTSFISDRRTQIAREVQADPAFALLIPDIRNAGNEPLTLDHNYNPVLQPCLK